MNQQRVAQLKAALGSRCTIPAHHYESDEIVEAADFVGDSYKLAVDCARTDARYIVFCGVRFMAESAAILAKPGQIVLHPEPTSGCPMADMITAQQAEAALQLAQTRTNRPIVPVVYMNSYADTKAFAGKHGGAVCTSSNAAKIVQHFLAAGKAVFFAPDYNLGINTADSLEVAQQSLKVTRQLQLEGDCADPRMFIWDGFCHVHRNFTLQQISSLRAEHAGLQVIVHPECNREVVQAADISGSTSQIYSTIAQSPAGSAWAVGTEWHFVQRIAAEFPEKRIIPVMKSICHNMSKITEQHLLRSLESIMQSQQDAGPLLHPVQVPPQLVAPAQAAMRRMIAIVEGTNENEV
jgi:quinolinate synthase